MAFRKIADGRTAVELISDHVRQSIIAGTLVPGQRLTQREIEVAFKVSAGSAREAFRALAGEGLLESNSRGAVVRRMGRTEVAETYRLREVVEGLAARLAAERVAAGSDTSDLIAARDRGEAAYTAGDYAAYSTSNRDFHDEIYRLSGSSRIAATARTLVTPIHRIHFQSLLDRRAVLRSVNGHRAIVLAIVGGDACAAEDEMRLHVRESAAAVLHTLSSVGRGVSRK